MSDAPETMALQEKSGNGSTKPSNPTEAGSLSRSATKESKESKESKEDKRARVRRSESESTRSRADSRASDSSQPSQRGSGGEKKRRKKDKSSAKKEKPPTHFDISSIGAAMAAIKDQTEKCQSQIQGVADECAKLEAENAALVQKNKQLEDQVRTLPFTALPCI